MWPHDDFPGLKGYRIAPYDLARPISVTCVNGLSLKNYIELSVD